MSTPPLVFDWKSLSSWRDRIEEIVPGTVRSELLTRISASAATFDSPDDVAVFERLYGAYGDFESLLDRFADRFPAAFPYVRMYHCCRCLDPGSYYEKGMLVLDSGVSAHTFAALYLNNPQFPGIVESDIAAAVESKADSVGRHGVIYFGLDDRHLLNCCSDYLTHGSEYLQSLAAELERRTGFAILEDLRRRGAPTVFCVRVPVERFEYETLRDLGQNAFYAWAYGVANQTAQIWEVDCSLETNKPLPPEFIIEHYHPARLRGN